MLMHLWELQGISFDYYYLRRELLLAAARPARGRAPLPAHDGSLPALGDPRRLAARRGPGGRPARRGRLSALGHDTAARTPCGASRRRSATSRSGSRAESCAPGAGEIAALESRSRAAVLTVAYDQLRRELLAGEVEREATAARSRAHPDRTQPDRRAGLELPAGGGPARAAARRARLRARRARLRLGESPRLRRAACAPVAPRSARPAGRLHARRRGAVPGDAPCAGTPRTIRCACTSWLRSTCSRSPPGIASSGRSPGASTPGCARG